MNGEAVTKTGCALLWRSCVARAGQWVRIFCSSFGFRFWIWWSRGAVGRKSSIWRKPWKKKALTARMKGEVGIPLVAVNRINMPEVAEDILAAGKADLVSLARPFLADPDFVRKAAEGRVDEINTCIACNQACLDHVFEQKVASCLVNPMACHETEMELQPAPVSKRIAVVGAGPAGLAFAKTAAERGHEIHEALGGQFKLACRVPGKEDYRETIRYFERQLELKVLTYEEVLGNERAADLGECIVIIGAGGVGVDVAEYLAIPRGEQLSYADEWGVDLELKEPGGLKAARMPEEKKRKLYLLRRSKGKPGQGLGKTTAWIRRMRLRHLGIIYTGEQLLEADSVVLCTGQEPVRELKSALHEAGYTSVHLIGGALKAGALDAERAIRQGVELALRL